MRFLFWVYTVLVVATSCTDSSFHSGEGPGPGYSDASKSIRQKRSIDLMLKGVKAFRQLIADATFVPSIQSKYYTKFVKDGDITKAYQDFYATNPQMVSQLDIKGVKQLHGIVGDREIVLRDPTTATGQRSNGLVYIDLIDTKAKRKLKPGDHKYSNRYIDRIVYRKPP